jgi:hypothetical protein
LNRGVAGDASVVDNDIDLEFGVRLGEEEVAARGDEECWTSRVSGVSLNWEASDRVLGFDLLGKCEGLRRRAVRGVVQD